MRAPFTSRPVPASGTARGYVTTTAQTLAGQKALNDGAKIGSSGTAFQLIVFLVSFTPTSVGAGATQQKTVTVTGLVAATDVVVAINGPGFNAGIGTLMARVTADNTLGVSFGNPTAASHTPPAGTYRVVVSRSVP